MHLHLVVGHMVSTSKLHVAVLAVEEIGNAVRVLPVAHEIGHLIEAAVTNLTPVRTFVGVDVQVVLEVALLIERFTTDITREWLGTGMNPAMRLECRNAVEGFIADLTGEWEIGGMRCLVGDECVLVLEGLAALVAVVDLRIVIGQMLA